MKASFISIVATFGLIGGSVAAPTAQEDDLITDDITAAVAGLGLSVPKLEARDEPQCKIQVRIISNWGESGMQRFRYAWQSDKKDYGDLGDDGTYGSFSDISIDIRNAIWDAGPGCSSVRRNLQGPWWDKDENAYLTDMSEVQGVAGYSISDCVRQVAENNWVKSSGCTNKLTL